MPGFGIGHNFGPAIIRFAGVSLLAETVAYLAAMSVQPDSTRRDLINSFIGGLQDDAAWSDLDWCELLAAHDAQAGRVNAVNPAQVATEVNSPTFTVDRGYAGNGTSSYLNTGWNPSTAGGKFLQDDCSLGIWCGTDVSSGAQYDVGNSNATINSRSGSNTALTAQSAAGSSLALAPATSVGFTSWSRTGATTGVAYKGGASIGAITSTSAALRNAPFLIGAANTSTTGGVTAGSFSTRRIQAVVWGRALTAGKQAAVSARLATFMAAIGA